jgi:glutamine synthetase
MSSPSGSSPDEAQAFLARHPEIEAVDVVLTDLNGVGRGKIIRRHELLPLYESGRHFPISVLALDITGEDVHETGLTWRKATATCAPGRCRALWFRFMARGAGRCW